MSAVCSELLFRVQSLHSGVSTNPLSTEPLTTRPRRPVEAAQRANDVAPLAVIRSSRQGSFNARRYAAEVELVLVGRTRGLEPVHRWKRFSALEK
jgi:hypothetical protein